MAHTAHLQGFESQLDLHEPPTYEKYSQVAMTLIVG